MTLKKKINHLRRLLMQGITGGIGTKDFKQINSKDSISFKRILINRPNQRLGNTLLITPLVQEVSEKFPNAKIDLFVKGKVAPIVFKNYQNVDKIIELPKKPFKELINYIKVWFTIKSTSYDLVINVEKSSSSGRLATKFAKGKYKLFGEEFSLEENLKNKEHYAVASVYQLNKFYAKISGENFNAKTPGLNIKLSEKEIQIGKETLNKIVVDISKPTIAFFTYATGDKCYSEEWWTNFYQLFKVKYEKNYNLIEILPVEDISMLGRKLPTYYSKDVREIAAVMHACKLLIAADSGMMHLGCAAPTKTIGLFKFDNYPKYKPIGEGNGYVKTNDKDGQEDTIKLMDKLL